MELHPFQQTLVDEIISNKIYNLRSFFEEHCLEMNPQNQIDQVAHHSLKCTVHECIDRTVKFVSLWKKLEKEEYIYTAADTSETRIFPFFRIKITHQALILCSLKSHVILNRRSFSPTRN